jgi:hypothetical protein
MQHLGRKIVLEKLSVADAAFINSQDPGLRPRLRRVSADGHV